MDPGLQRWTASALSSEFEKQLAGQRPLPYRDLLAMGGDFRPESAGDRAKQSAAAHDALSRSVVSFRQVALGLIASKKSDTEPSAAAALSGAERIAESEADDDEPSPTSISAQRRRRMSLMSTSMSANVMGSHGVMKKRLSLPSEETFRSIEPIPRERRGATTGAAIAAAAPERPASSSMSARKSVELSERDVVLPGFRARVFSARAAIKPDKQEVAWTKAFKIDYAPQSFNDVKRKRTQSEPVTGPASVSAKPGGGDGIAEVAPGHTKIRRRPWAQPAPANATRSGRVEIHYESCLPKEQWLQVRPKKFVSNHKHGTVFENRSPVARRKVERVQEVTVWENPYHILLFEKAAKQQ